MMMNDLKRILLKLSGEALAGDKLSEGCRTGETDYR